MFLRKEKRCSCSEWRMGDIGTFPATGVSGDAETGHWAGVPREDKVGSSRTGIKWKVCWEMEELKATGCDEGLILF